MFAYPRTGRPGEPNPGGDDNWDAIPGARGCTPQACSFRDEAAAFAERGARVVGVSTQDTDYQREAAERLHLPYPLLSDEHAELGLPTFEVEGMTLLKRLTLFVRDGVVEDLIYPVFPPDRSAADALGEARLVGGDRDVAARRLGGRQRVLTAQEQQLGGLLAVPARDAGGGGLPARGGLADAVQHVARLAEPAARQDDRELGPVDAGQEVDLAQLVAPARAALLDQAVALASRRGAC